jgi:hypothetical protein
MMTGETTMSETDRPSPHRAVGGTVLAGFVIALLAILAGLALMPLLSRIPHGRDSDEMTAEELSADAEFYRQAVAGRCGIPEGWIAGAPMVRDGEISWYSTADGRRYGFRFDGHTGELFCAI